MRTLPEQVGLLPQARATSVVAALAPHLEFAADGLYARRVEDAALTVLASVYAGRGPVRERLVRERLTFDRLVRSIGRCPAHREEA